MKLISWAVSSFDILSVTNRIARLWTRAWVMNQSINFTTPISAVTLQIFMFSLCNLSKLIISDFDWFCPILSLNSDISNVLKGSSPRCYATGADKSWRDSTFSTQDNLLSSIGISNVTTYSSRVHRDPSRSGTWDWQLWRRAPLLRVS